MYKYLLCTYEICMYFIIYCNNSLNNNSEMFDYIEY